MVVVAARVSTIDSIGVSSVISGEMLCPFDLIFLSFFFVNPGFSSINLRPKVGNEPGVVET